MRVVDQRRDDKAIGALSAGDAFEHDGAFYVKLSFHSKDLQLGNDSGSHYAVNLVTGVVIKLHQDEIVGAITMECNIVP